MTWVKRGCASVRDNPGMRAPLERTALPDAEAIGRLVDAFYDKVRVDPVIGPIFNEAVHDWPEHKRLLTSFWCSVVLRAQTYRGNPMQAHRPWPIEARHFDHWIALWKQTAAELMPEAEAATMGEFADRIGQSLRYGLGLQGGATPLKVPIASL